MDTKKEFNEILNHALKVKGCLFRKDGRYMYDMKVSEEEFRENFVSRGYDYFTLFTKDNQLVEYVLLGKTPIKGDLNAHKAAKKYTNYKSEEEEDDKFRSAIMRALKTQEELIFKNAKEGYLVGKQQASLLKDILQSHYFLYIVEHEIYEFFRFDIRTITSNMELPKL